ncbi:MAG: hypothetical protein DRI57_17250 [Deltaproteobacteria bacterium]|nr:MAG: hypothetical protein DRI57_17250 [Deltaproteobacteria bacterium]
MKFFKDEFCKGVTDMPKRQFCTFQIAERLFGVDILDVKEINLEAKFTPVFHAPKEVEGYVNIRGQIYLILNLRLLLGFEKKAVDEASRLVLFKPQVEEPFGVLVDRIGDVVDVDVTQIENHDKDDQRPSKDGKRKSAELWDGVCKLEEGLLVVLNSRNMLKSIGKT